MWWSLIAVVAVLLPGGICAQAITMESILQIDPGLDGPGAEALTGGSRVALDRRGRWLVAPSPHGDRFAVFDGEGNFLRYVGRAGEGPGEYRMISDIVVTERYIHVFDQRTDRRTMLDHDFQLIRTDPVRGTVQFAFPFEGDQVVMYANIPLQMTVGRPVHVLGPDGTLASFGRPAGVYRQGGMPNSALGRGTGARAWSVEHLSYRVTEWSLADRTSIRSQLIEADWFLKYSPPDPTHWPRSVILGIGESQGMLWVIGAMPDANWTDRIEGRVPDIPRSRLVDGVVDVRDPETLQLLASRRFDHPFLHGGFVPGTDFLVQALEDEAGGYRLVVLRPRFSLRGSESDSQRRGR